MSYNIDIEKMIKDGMDPREIVRLFEQEVRDTKDKIDTAAAENKALDKARDKVVAAMMDYLAALGVIELNDVDVDPNDIKQVLIEEERKHKPLFELAGLAKDIFGSSKKDEKGKEINPDEVIAKFLSGLR